MRILFYVAIIVFAVYMQIRHSRKLADERKANEEIRQREKADFENAKNELLAKIEKWEKDGVLAISVKDKVLDKYNDIYFIGENFYLKSGKSSNVTKGTLMFIDTEVCFLSDVIVRTIPFSQTLKVDIGPCEIRFTSKKYQNPLSFFCITDNHYKDRLEVCDAYARWYLLNGFKRKDFIQDLETVLNLPLPVLQKIIVDKK